MVDKPENKEANGKEISADQAQPSTKGSLGAWMPLMLALILMPLSAFLVTKLYLVKQLDTKIQEAMNTNIEASDSTDPDEKTSHEAESTKDHGQPDTASDHAGEGSESAHNGEGDGSSSSDNTLLALTPYQIESMVVNVRQTNASRFLIASISVDCLDQAQRQNLKDKLIVKDPFIRDAAQRVLSNFTLEELEDEASARRKAAAALKVEFRDFLGESPIDFTVLFPQWTLQ